MSAERFAADLARALPGHSFPFTLRTSCHTACAI
jgi:hypothetical protein